MEKTTRPNAPLQRPLQYGWHSGPPSPSSLGEAVRSGAGGTPQEQAQPTSLGMEVAVVYQKRIDNSDVQFRHDPRDRDSLRWQVSLGLFIVLVVLVATAPRLWVRHSGYRQANLGEKIEQLIVVRDQLIVEKGRR